MIIDAFKLITIRIFAHKSMLFAVILGVLLSSTITSTGTVSDIAGHIVINSLTALALTLNDGTTVGEQKIFTNKGAGTATITPTSLADGTSFTLAQNKAAMCIWDGTNWFRIVSA